MRIVETIKAGTFTRSIQEKQDVRCLFNHEPDNILGRTANQTMQLKEDPKGLYFDTDFDLRTSIAQNVRAFVDRGDVTGCSFSFSVKKQQRTEVEEEDKLIIHREIHDVDLYDVGPVTFPAYEGTDVKARTVELRSLFPEGVPDSVLAHAPELRTDPPADPDGDGTQEPDDDPDDVLECSCRCRACFGAECDECDMYMETCGDASNCGAGMRSKRSARDDAKTTKRVDGEDLPASSFLYVGDPNKTDTWALPWKFSTDAKTKSHLQNALARFNHTKKIPADKKAGVYKKLVAKCKEYGIHVAGEDDGQKSAELTALEQAKARTETLRAELSMLA